MTRILLVTYGGGHVAIIRRVASALADVPGVQAVVLALSTAQVALREAGERHTTLRDYRKLIFDGVAERYGMEFARKWHVPSSGLSFEDSVLYLGCSMRDLVETHGEEGARARVEQHGRRAFLPVQTMRKIVELESPDALVTTNSPRAERAATLVGNERGLPTLNIHDDLAFVAREYPLTADRIAVMSEIAADNLVAQGHRRERIVITGQPALDSILEEADPAARESTRRALGLDPMEKTILLATSQAGEAGRIVSYCPLVDRAVSGLKGTQLVIKPHPCEDIDAYRSYVLRAGSRARVVQDVSVRRLIGISDCVVGFASTVLMESILMGTPVLSVNMTSQEDPIPFVRWGLAREARSADGIFGQLKALLDGNGSIAEFLSARDQYLGSALDGRATERVRDLVLSMIGAHAPESA